MMMIIDESFHFRIDTLKVGSLVEVGETVYHVTNVEERFVRAFPPENNAHLKPLNVITLSLTERDNIN
jgi:hypothetical protein